MSSRFRIGDLTLDTGRRLLLCDSKPIPLGRLTYRLLLTLVEAAPNMVSHDELINSVWGGRSVSPETISQRIKLLRDALSDDPHNPRYLDLVRGQGYRLLPRVEVLPNESPARHRLRWVVPIGAAISLAAAAAIVFWIVAAQTDPVRESTSIAVLPFADLSAGRDQQYLADGIAEEILNVLSRATTLRVIARTSSFSFRGQGRGCPADCRSARRDPRSRRECAKSSLSPTCPIHSLARMSVHGRPRLPSDLFMMV